MSMKGCNFEHFKSKLVLQENHKSKHWDGWYLNVQGARKCRFGLECSRDFQLKCGLLQLHNFGINLTVLGITFCGKWLRDGTTPLFLLISRTRTHFCRTVFPSPTRTHTHLVFTCICGVFTCMTNGHIEGKVNGKWRNGRQFCATINQPQKSLPRLKREWLAGWLAFNKPWKMPEKNSRNKNNGIEWGRTYVYWNFNGRHNNNNNNDISNHNLLWICVIHHTSSAHYSSFSGICNYLFGAVCVALWERWKLWWQNNAMRTLCVAGWSSSWKKA